MGAAGAKAGRATADIATLGLWRMGKAFKRKCGICGHPMSEHSPPAVQSTPPVPTAAPAAPPASPPSSREDVVQLLERLAALKASGAITDQEYEAQKAELLG